MKDAGPTIDFGRAQEAPAVRARIGGIDPVPARPGCQLGRCVTALAAFVAQVLLFPAGLHAQPNPALNHILELDGPIAFVDLGTNGPVLGTNFTEELWLMPSPSIGDAYYGVLGGTRTPERFELGLNRAPSIYVRRRTWLHGGFGDGTTWHGWSAPDVLTLGQWNHVAATYDGSRARVLVNGQVVAERAIAAAPLVTPLQWIGRMDGAFVGRIDEVRVWNVTRTAQQIQEGMTAPLTHAPPGLVARWSFEDTTGKLVRGSSSNGFHGRLMGNARVVPSAFPAVSVAAAWPTLQLDGTGGVELPAGLFATLDNATIEAWVKWAHFDGWQRFFSYGTLARDAYIGVDRVSGQLQFVVRNQAQSFRPLQVDPPLPAGQWYHIAAVSGPRGMRLYVNGDAVAANDVTNTLAALPPGPAWIGRWTDDASGFQGAVAEIRLWSEIRTAEEIRANFNRQLTGREPGLFALWNFANRSQPARDASPNAHHGSLFGSTLVSPESVADGGRLAGHAELTGRVTDPSGRPVPNAAVTLFRGSKEEARTRTSLEGEYRMRVPASGEAGDMWVWSGNGLAASKGMVLQPGEQRRIDLQLLMPATLSGKVTNPEGQPQAGIMVQLIAQPEAPSDGPANEARNLPLPFRLAMGSAPWVFTRGDGSYRFRRVAPGQYLLRARASNGFLPYPGGQPLALGSGTNFTCADFLLPPQTPDPGRQAPRSESRPPPLQPRQ